MSTRLSFARHLTDAFLSGDWSREAMESAVPTTESAKDDGTEPSGDFEPEPQPGS